MLHHPNQVVTREMISCTTGTVALACESNVFEVSVHRLRRRNDDPFSANLLTTECGIGYRLTHRQKAEDIL